MTSKIKWIVAGTLFACGISASAQMESNLKMGAPQPPQADFMQEMDVAMKKMDHDMDLAPMNGNAD